MRVRLILASALFSALFVLAVPTSAQAHGLSSQTATIKLVNGKIVGQALLPVTNLGLIDLNSDGGLDQSEFAAQLTIVQGNLVAAISQQIRIGVDGHPIDIVSGWLNPVAGVSENSTSGVTTVPITFVTQNVGETPNVVTVTVEQAPANSAIILDVLDVALVANLDTQGSATFTLSAMTSASSFFLQGLRHIYAGLDHMLFLIVLALGLFKKAITRASALRALALVSAFTLGHAVSFCLAYFGVITAPTLLVEPVIALSITVAAILAMTRIEWERWWIIATAIGLVHGLGFASSLAQLGIATNQHVAAVVFFNLGIDVAQGAIVGAILVSLYLARRWLGPMSEKLRLAALVGIACVGLVWSIQRIAEPLIGLLPFFT